VATSPPGLNHISAQDSLDQLRAASARSSSNSPGRGHGAQLRRGINPGLRRTGPHQAWSAQGFV